jgi:hypothetical protein
MATATIGPLENCQSVFFENWQKTYLMKKIHLHEVWSTMTPPRSGPRRFAMAKTELIIPEYKPIFSGTINFIMETKVKLKSPEPPTP